MKIILVLLFTLSVFAAKKDTAKEEVELAVSTVYEKRNEQQIVENNEVMKKCKEDNKDNITAAETCVRKAVESLSDEDIEKLGDNIKLSTYDTKASKSAKTIREYLSERMSNALRGEPKKGVKEITLREMKFVDHALYSKIYRSQIGKNILLETTNYCISNFGHNKGPRFLVFPPQTSQFNFDNPKASIISGLDPKNPSYAEVVKYDPAKKEFSALPRTNLIATGVMTEWSEAYEYETCDSFDSKEISKCETGRPVLTAGAIKVSNRSSDTIAHFKSAEFDFGPDYMKAKISFCTQTVIKNMCERYRCKNVYSTNVSEKITNNCAAINVPILDPNNEKQKLEYQPPTDSKLADVSGIMACGLMDRLKEYRRVIGALGEIDKINEESKNKADGTGFKVDDVFGGQYRGGKGEKSIEDITTIASSEFKDIQFVDADEMTKLREECFEGGTLDQSNKKCAALVENEFDDEKSLSIRTEMEAETASYLKRVNDLKEKNDKDGLLEFLKEQGLDKKYGKLEPEELARLISNQYKSQRASLKKSMMDKYNQTRNIDTTGMSAEEKTNAKASKLTDIAKSNIVNMEKEKEKLETLLQYNNILTSYLGATIDDGKDKTDTYLSYQRQIEMDQAKKSGDTEFVDEYSPFFNNGQEAQSTQDANLQIDINFIDSLLGNEEEKTEAKLEKKESE